MSNYTHGAFVGFAIGMTAGTNLPDFLVSWVWAAVLMASVSAILSVIIFPKQKRRSGGKKGT